MVSNTLRKLMLVGATGLVAGLVGCNHSELDNLAAPENTGKVVASSASQPGAKGLARAMEAQKKSNSKLLGKKGIVGTGIGQDDAGNPQILVFTSGPGATDIPDSIDGIPVVVEETGSFKPLQATGGTGGSGSIGCYDGALNVKTPRPVPIGVSVGTAGFSGGTYGARLRDASGNLYMLSNNHVFAGRNAAPLGATAIQPRPQDGGSALTDSVGALFDFEPLVFFEVSSNGGHPVESTPIPENIMDAAVVATSAELAGNSTPCDGYGVAGSMAVAPSNGSVMKYGRTTGLTTGNINAFNATVDITFGVLPNGNLKVARFVNQIVIRKPGFCDSGDSGSLVVTGGNNPVGLLFAGSAASNGTCIANPILSVLSRFNMTVDGI